MQNVCQFTWGQLCILSIIIINYIEGFNDMWAIKYKYDILTMKTLVCYI